MFFIYNMLLALAAVGLAPYYLLRGWRTGKYHGSLSQRLGRPQLSIRETTGRSVWLHAVSVGEVLSCQELVRELRARFPRTPLLLSTATATGQRLAAEKLGSIVDGIFYAPVDFPGAVRSTLRRVRPFLVIVAETEIWPNLYRETKRFGASLLIVNARISDRSAGRYRFFQFFFRHVLALPDAILAQSGLDRERLIAAGAPAARVEVGGNFKFDVRAAEAPPPAEVAALLDRLRPSAVILAGSTREGEEEMVLAAFDRLTERRDRLLLILAPRHPERFEEVAGILSRRQHVGKFAYMSRLPDQTLPDLPGVLLLDTLGELASLYALADVVFVGGSLIPWGGHNVLEPASARRPVVTGPHMQNFRAITDALLAAGGLVQVNSPEELAPALERLLDNPAEATAIGRAAQACAEAHRGATRRAADRAEHLYHRAVPCTPPTASERLLLSLPARVWKSAAGRAPLHPQRLNACTVSIGNLTTGGTGKTPVILWLLEQLQGRGVSCALLTRGYRRASPEAVTVLEPGAVALEEVTGDEAQLVLRRFRIPIGIAANRYAAGRAIEDRFHPDLFLLDDGFQHRRLARDLDIVLIDVTEPFGRRALLPVGRLREPPEALARAGAIVLTRCLPHERWEALQEEIRRYNPHAPIFFARFEPDALVDAATGAEQPLAHLAGRPVVGFCGVGNPAAFAESLVQAGFGLADLVRFRDHHRYSASDLERVANAAQRTGASALVTTEKDLINLGRLSPRLDLYWLRMRVAIDRAEALLDLIPCAAKVPR
jgi:tetraacyldisaccharide 4'-kinase